MGCNSEEIDMKIEKNIPMPPKKGGGSKKGRPKSDGRSIYPFDDMEVGDSFFADEKTISVICSAIGAYKRNRNNGKEFTARKERSGVRVWRCL